MTDTESHGTRYSIRQLDRRQKTIGVIAVLIALALLVAGAVMLSKNQTAEKGRGPGAAGAAGGPGGGGGRRGGPASTVGVANATKSDIPVELEALGTVTPAATVTVRPQVSGVITKVYFREGQAVRRGQLLVEIDPRPYQMALLQAQGTLARDQAQLENARLTLGRFQTLLKQDSIARQEVDTQAATVRQLEGTVMTDRGAVGTAKLNLEYTRVAAPVTGRVGLRVVDVGNYITAGDANGLVVLTTLSPIDIEFTIPQDQAPLIEQRLAKGGAINAVALDRSRTETLDQGTFSTLDNQVDTTTGTIRAKARFQNAGGALYPNQFVNVRLMVDTLRDVVTVPSSAVRQGNDGPFVWVVGADRTVKKRKVKTGQVAGDKVAILSGLNLGERVVTEGGDRLTEGGKVQLPGQKPERGRRWNAGARRRHGRSTAAE